MMMTSRWVASNMDMHRRNTNREIVRIDAAVTFVKRYLYSYQGRFKNYLIFGGVDNEGPHIRVVHAHGSVDRVPYGTLGSGSLAAMAIFESRWKPDMTQEEAIKLVCDATNAGVYNDLGSGFGVDIVIIRKGFHKVVRGFERVEKPLRKLCYTPKRGTSKVLSCKKFDIEIEEENVVQDDKMEVE
jgi:20S proteasome subunit beta 2